MIIDHVDHTWSMVFIKPWSTIKLIFYIIKLKDLRIHPWVGRGEGEHHNQDFLNWGFWTLPWSHPINCQAVMYPSGLHGKYNPIAYIAVSYISPPGWILLSLQLRSKMRKAVVLHGNIVFIALEHFNIFGFSDNIQKILRETRVLMSFLWQHVQDRDMIFHYHFL